ncbi:FhaA domain-containing protein [Blastococcus deserti]|uniref:FhaA domain-containing protein n=1 Tax=Blastococcus deserti TaxID=2259033 RepID=A0ABW4XB53_9ACTN
MGVLQRFERRLEGMVGLAFARIFKGKVHPAEIAKALQREADEQRSIMGEGRVLVPNVYVVSLGRTDFEHLGQWSDQLAEELADMVAEHIDDEGYQVFDKVTVRLEEDAELPTGVFEVSSHVADPARPPAREDLAVAAPPRGAPAPGHPPLPPLPPLRGRVATDTGKQGPSMVGRAGNRTGVTHVLVVDGPGTRHELSTGRNVIGRGTEADIRLPDTGVSRKHVDVVLDGGTATVEDLGSTNGTLVNGRRVTRQALADGDVIRIGHSVLVYRQETR